MAGYCLEQDEAMSYITYGATFNRMQISTRFVYFLIIFGSRSEEQLRESLQRLFKGLVAVTDR